MGVCLSRLHVWGALQEYGVLEPQGIKQVAFVFPAVSQACSQCPKSGQGPREHALTTGVMFGGL